MGDGPTVRLVLVSSIKEIGEFSSLSCKPLQWVRFCHSTPAMENHLNSQKYSRKMFWDAIQIEVPNLEALMSSISRGVDSFKAKETIHIELILLLLIKASCWLASTEMCIPH